MTDFIAFPKIPRLTRECVITEKVDGTNAQVFFSEDMAEVRFGSRNRWITPESDNYGFAAWATANLDELKRLGPGRHFGEWWGNGIQRKYAQATKRFALFNVSRWSDPATRPACCDVVPTLFYGTFNESAINQALEGLISTGSVIAPGFMDPEGVVVYHESSCQLFKKLIQNDHFAKSELCASS